MPDLTKVFVWMPVVALIAELAVLAGFVVGFALAEAQCPHCRRRRREEEEERQRNEQPGTRPTDA